MKNFIYAASGVDAYLAACPPDAAALLQKIRRSILKAAPEAEEKISYQVPYYKYKGALVCFAWYPGHCSFFVVNKQILADMAEDLKGFRTSGTTIHFSPEHPLPLSLVRKIVLRRVKENQGRV